MPPRPWRRAAPMNPPDPTNTEFHKTVFKSLPHRYPTRSGVERSLSCQGD